MRLLDTSTHLFSEFDAGELLDPLTKPRYAILSHTWVKRQEVSFEEWGSEACRSKSGYDKITSACRIALADDLPYVWIDTCCIDKRSSAELSEAINSMYAWYSNANVCYAYLDDLAPVPHDDDDDDDDDDNNNHSDGGSGGAMAADDGLALCRWWTRGWTLQELLAPREVRFFDATWTFRFTRESESLRMARISGIDRSILRGLSPMHLTSIARRMSWASRRETSRPEDKAYCLMGIFGVHMPMIYGEGERAFIRLQEEIIRQSDDQSIFAWKDDADRARPRTGLLAPAPSCFRDSARVVPFHARDADEPFALTNKGLSIKLHLTRVWGAYYRAALCCKAIAAVCIYVRRLPVGANQYARVRPHELYQAPTMGDARAVFVRQDAVPHDFGGDMHVELRNGPDPKAYRLECVVPAHPELGTVWDGNEGIVRREAAKSWIPIGQPVRWLLAGQPGALAGLLKFMHLRTREEFWVVLGSSWELGLAFDVSTLHANASPDSFPPGFNMLEPFRRSFKARPPNTSCLHASHHTVEVGVAWETSLGHVFCVVNIKLTYSREPQTASTLVPTIPYKLV